MIEIKYTYPVVCFAILLWNWSRSIKLPDDLSLTVNDRFCNLKNSTVTLYDTAAFIAENLSKLNGRAPP
jgi:hypothetical protein